MLGKHGALMQPDAFQKLVVHADLAYQIFCSQISQDYLTFLKSHVLRDLPITKAISLGELKIILLIDGSNQKCLKSADIASVYRVDPATVTRGVNGLREKEMISFEDDPQDSRSKILKLTDKSAAVPEAYLSRALGALTEANDRLGFMDQEKFANEGHSAFHMLRDRAAAFRDFDLRKRQSFRQGMGQSTRHLTLSKEVLLTNADLLFQVYAQQISLDYQSFLRRFIVSEINKHFKMGLREIRTLMAIDFYAVPVTSTNIAQVMRFEPATISRAVTTLQDFGMISIRDDDWDARVKLLSLTDKGQEYASVYKTICTNKLSLVDSHYSFGWEQKTRIEVLEILARIKTRSAALASLRRRKASRKSNIDKGRLHPLNYLETPKVPRGVPRVQRHLR